MVIWQKQDEMELFSLTHPQKRIWYTEQLNPGIGLINIGGYMRIKGSVDPKVMERAVIRLYERNDALRFKFVDQDGEYNQYLRDIEDYSQIYHDLTNEIDPIQAAFQIMEAETTKPFPKGQIFHCFLVKVAEDDFFWYLKMHHMISDGWASALLLKDLGVCYQQVLSGEISDNDAPTSYLEYLEDEKKYKSSKRFQKNRDFWLDNLSDLPEAVTLAPKGQASQKPEGKRYSFLLDQETADLIKGYVADSGSSVYGFFMTVLFTYMYRITGEKDIVIGTPVLNRSSARLKKTFGMFVSTMPFRVQMSDDQTFGEFLKVVLQNQMRSYRHQQYPMDLLVVDLELPQKGNNKIFDVSFSYQNPSAVESFNGYPTEVGWIFNGYEENSLTIHVNEWMNQGILQIDFDYSLDVFGQEEIEQMSKHFINLAKEVIRDSNQPLNQIQFMGQEEKERLLRWNDTQVDYPKEKSLAQLFEEQVARTPDQLAVLLGDDRLTYRELNAKANQLARVLRAKGVGPDQVVGMIVDRSLEMIIGIMAILKAGGAYLPIDPNHPIARIKYMLSDCQVRILLTQEDLIEGVDFSGETLFLNDEELYRGDSFNLERVNSSDDLAYVIYTSGTTGKPKGNLTMHYNIARVVKNTNYIEITPDDKVLQLSNYAFDGSTFDIYGALLNGATLVMVTKDILLDLAKLSNLIKEKGITVSFVTTALFNTLVDTNIECLAKVRKVLFGGERVSVSHARRAVEYLGRDRIIHVYGPTESTVYATYYHINEVSDEADNIPIGSPLANTEIYIVDKNNQLQPIGVAGELCISGDGLARGYLNRPDLTAEKFIPSPFVPGEKMYKTGDLARWLPDSNIEFLGRIDRQVKIRGFRIELGEIENQLLAYEQIREAKVVDKEDSNNKFLCAYLVVDAEVSVADLKAHLAEELPDFMIPAYFIFLDQMPLNQNGKIDLKALPEVAGNFSIETEFVAPESEIEIRMAKIWSEILEVEVGLNDNFFELGGHSLKATKLVSRILREFKVELALKEIFNHSTISNLLEYMGQKSEVIYTSIPKISERPYYPVSSAQKRLFALKELEGENITYNMPVIRVIEGELDIERFRDAFKHLIQRHGALRTSFAVVDGVTVQKVHPEVEFDLPYTFASEEELPELIQSFIRPFDLSQAPLLRIQLVKYGTKHLFMLDMHHIISDGVSMSIFFDEFFKLYTGSELEELTIQYKDFSAWQNQRLQSEKIKRQEEYWLQTFAENVAVLNLPTDYPRPLEKTFEGSRIDFGLGKELSARVSELTIKNGTTLYVALLTAFNILLAKYSGQEDIIVGSPIAGRAHADLHHVMGMFVNTLAMRNYPKSDRTFLDLLGEVNENALQAYENQDYQFEMLIEKLQKEIIPRDLSRNALFDVMFALQNVTEEDLQIDDLQFEPYPFEYNISKFDLTLNAAEGSQGIQFSLEYSTSLFRKETMEKMTTHLVNLINAVVENPKLPIKAIELISNEERHRLLDEFNQTQTDDLANKTINQLFEIQVARTPEKVAIVFEGEELTYRQLNEKANQLARGLRTKGVSQDQIVGLMVDKSLEMVIAQLAILKAGGAYLSIDPEYPVSRIEYMLLDSGSDILLTEEQYIGTLDFTGEVIDIHDQRIYSDERSNLDQMNQSTDLAYVIYTSGTTGKPKGVLLEHTGMANLKNMFERNFGIDAQDRIIQFASSAFDASVWETYMALLTGASLHILTKDTIVDYSKFTDYLNQNQITVVTLPPIYLENINPNHVDTLRMVITAGSATNYPLVNKWREKVRYINAYGPTETTICATTWEACTSESQTVPIGQPIDNTQIYIVDQNLQIVPQGVVGELCISTVGLARGYQNRDKLTQEKFVPNPYLPEQKMYRSGDLARWLPDGKIEFLGRIDHQVKIRGYRIELGEIENQLAEWSKIEKVIVLVKDDPNQHKYLIAYYTATEELTASKVREYLSSRLPDYMIPSHLIQLEEMPLNASGKIDRKALPESDGNLIQATEYVAPRVETEIKIAAIWSEILGVEQVGINDNFFELGGDSIKAIQILAKASQFGLHLKMKDIFRYKTIASLVENVDLTQTKLTISQEEVTGEVLLTPIQKWFFAQKLTDQQHWNQSNLFGLKADINLARLEEVFKKIIEHHDALRMEYSFEKDQVLQFNRSNNQVEFTLPSVDLSQYEYSVQQAKIRELGTELQSSFNLEKDLLFKAIVFDLGEQGKRLLISIHHLVVDGVSWRILLEDIETLYNSNLEKELPLKTTSFNEWSHRLHRYAEEEEIDVTYWTQIEPAKVSSLVQGQVKGNYLKDHQSLLIELDEIQTEKLLTQVNWAYNTEINDILLAALLLSLTEKLGLENLLVNLEGHGREEIIENVDLSRTIGWFTSAYPAYLSKQPSFDQTIKYVKENLRRIPEKGLNFGIAKYLQYDQRLQGLRPEISFNYLGQFGDWLEDDQIEGCLRGCQEDGGLSLSGNNQHPYLIDVNGSIVNGKLQMLLGYNGKYLDEELLKGVQKSYQDRLNQIIDHCVSQTGRTYTVSDFGIEDLISDQAFSEVAENLDLEQIKMYGLTPMQEGMLFHSLMSTEGTNYYEQICYFIEGELDVDQFKAAWREVLNRHEAFRTRFIWEKLENAIQIITSEPFVKIDEYDLTTMSSVAQTDFIDQFKKDDLQEKFDLEQGKLNRLALVKLSTDQYWVCWTSHHIVLDGWSLPIILSELFEIYEHLLYQQELPVKPVAQFGDYLEWLSKQDTTKSLRFWQKHLVDFEEPTYLPADNKRDEVIAKSITQELVFDEEKTRLLNEFCRENDITMNALVQTVWAILLQKYNNTQQSCFGMTVSGRPVEVKSVESIVGIFINTVPIVVRTEDQTTLKDLLLQVNHDLAEIQEHEHMALAEIQKVSGHSENLFDSLIVFENYPANFADLGKNLELSISLDSIYDLTNYDLTMVVVADDRLSLKQVYNADAFELDTIERIQNSIVQIVESILTSVDQPVVELSLVSETEQRKLLFELNDTEADYPKSKTIQQLFEEQVVRTPDQVAVSYEGQSLTYRELNARANQLARVLKSKGVGADQIVGMLLDRSLEMIVGILAILKAGGAYLPIDPDYPAERIEFTLTDSGTQLLLTTSDLVDSIQYDYQMICLDDFELYQGETTNLVNQNQSDHLAYIIYTSGTTGKPKGVMIEHRNVVRLLFNDQFQFDFSVQDTWTMFHSYCFDFSVWEMYGALLYGGRLIVIPKMVARDPEKFLEVLKVGQVTVLNQTPSAFYNLINAELKEQDQRLKIRYVIFGGEALNPIKLQDWKAKYPATQLINMYGITETTVHVTFKEITDYEIEHNISNIGKPIPTLTTYVLDANLKLLPMGVPGELCVGGDGVARGYLNRPELTETKFVRNPYQPDERIYRSGDLVRLLSNGEMEYLGRIDHQVKIRGFRIELGEIESKLLNHPEVTEAIVLARENENGDKYLCAYFMAEQEKDMAELRKYLSKNLPEYMIPAYFVQLTEIPLTSNGKVNRKGLPEPNHEINHGQDYLAPRNVAEEALAQVWQEVLGVKQVGINDNFFALGGDSIKAIQISSRLQRYNFKLEMQKLFQNPTIAEQSDYVQLITCEMDQSTVEGQVQLTPIQKWFFARNLKQQHHFNQSLVLYNEQGFNADWIPQLFQKIVEHHDALRMVYQIEGAEIQQINRGIDEKLFDLQVYDYQDQDHYEQLIDQTAAKLQSSINLEKGPLVKLGLFQTQSGDYLLIAIHHLVIDGVSWRILFEDFATGYQQLAQGQEILFPLKSTSYQEWAEQLLNYAKSEKLLQEMSYWRKLEETELAPLPRDYSSMTDQKKDSGLVTIGLSKEETAELLKEVHQAYNTEINDILLAALAASLRDWSQEGQILISLEGHGREEIIKDVDVNRTVGWFTSIYPVLIDLENKVGPGEIIKGTKESLRVIPNKGVGYGILKYLTSSEHKEDLQFKLQPEVSFNYLGQLDQDVSTDVFSLADLPHGQDMDLADSRFNTLDINGIIKDERLILNIEYNQREYQTSTISRFTDNLIQHLREMINHCLAKEETELTLSDFSDDQLDEEELEDIFGDLEELFEV